MSSPTLRPPAIPSAASPSMTPQVRGHVRWPSGQAPDALMTALMSPACSAQQRRALLAELGGGFAMTIADGSGRCLLAVDRFATQTLCYRHDAAGVTFAERADQLGQAGDIDPQALYDYLYFHCIPSPRTIFREVHRLPAGHYLWWDGMQLTVEPYWTPRFAPAPVTSFGEQREAFMALLEQAVRRQLDGHGRTACFLSGGTDSSTVAGMTARVGGQAATTYSIGFDAAGYDEMAFARIAARHFGSDHREYYVTPEDLVAGIPTVAAHYDQPFGNSSALPAYYCALKARQDGFEHMLAGDGGDELFGGNSRYAKQRVFSWWQRVPAPLRRGLLDPLFLSDLAARTPGLRKAHSYVEQANDPMPHRLLAYNLLMRLGPAQVLTPGLLAEVDQAQPGLHQQQVWSSVQGASELNTTLAFDWRYTLAESDLPKVRETTALAGVGVGFPMLDDDLLAFSLKLPDSYKLRGLKLRWFFKEALRGFLPDEIIRKKKQGFGLPFGVWTLRHAELHKLAQDSVLSLVDRGIVNAQFAEALFGRWLAEVPGYYGEMVWILMMLEQWLRGQSSDYRIGR